MRLANLSRRAVYRHKRPTRVVTRRAASERRSDLAEEIERARRTLDEIIKEATEELFVEEATSEAIGEACAFTIADALKGAVQRRAHSLDGVFMNTISSYIVAVERDGPRQILEILLQTREFAVEAVRENMPPELRWVDTLSQISDNKERNDLLTFALRNGIEGGMDARSLADAAGQLIDDIETRSEVADRRLLARLCSVRELARDLSDDNVRPVQFPEDQIPRHEASFIKELVSIGGATMSEERKALISRAFSADWSGAGGISLQDVRPSRGMLKRGSWKSHEAPDEKMYVTVRPGRFMDCLGVLIQSGNASTDAKKQRLMDIRADALAVLERLSE